MFRSRDCLRAGILRPLLTFQQGNFGIQRRSSHYKVLGVGSTATLEEIKQAFREKAKVVHPDASPASSPSPDRTDWIQLLTAYQILSDPRSRQLYDLSLSDHSASFLRNAAAAGVKGGSHQDVEVNMSWGSWAASVSSQKGSSKEESSNGENEEFSVLGHLKTNLESEWNAALRHAYLGPRLDDLERGQLPDCFEADERATAETNEVLHLVSGRQLLGCVKLRQMAQLTAEEWRAWIGQGKSELKKDAALLTAFQPPKSECLGGGGVDGGREEELCGEGGISQKRTTNMKVVEEEECDTFETDQSSSGGDRIEAATPPKNSKTRDRNGELDPAQLPQILDLTLDDEVIATAVGRSTLSSQQYNQYMTNHLPHDPLSTSTNDNNGVVTTLFYKGSALIGQLVEDEVSLATKRGLSASRILDPSGKHTHSVIRNVTPLVRHLTFVSELATAPIPRPGFDGFRANKGLSPGRPPKLGKAVVARAHRAWLPPSTFWLFKPRSYDHDIGGWVISWPGEAHRNHPACLAPEIVAMVAALDSLDHEAAKQQPQGLFQRLKHGDEIEKGGGGLKGWLKAALRFHRGHE